MEFVLSAAQNPVTPQIILVGAFALIFLEAWKVSREALMGDLYNDGGEE